jgi:hypothetical protein
MGKTNSLTSHHPERRSHSADKQIPKEVMKKARKPHSGKSQYAKTLKKMHTKKVRQYVKKQIKKRLDEE